MKLESAFFLKHENVKSLVTIIFLAFDMSSKKEKKASAKKIVKASSKASREASSPAAAIPPSETMSIFRDWRPMMGMRSMPPPEEEDNEYDEEEEDDDYFYMKDERGRLVRFNLDGIDLETREKAIGASFEDKQGFYCQRGEIALWVDYGEWDEFEQEDYDSLKIPKDMEIRDT
jgi:hypothetical protein